LVDTGPLVALMDDREPYHAWARDRLAAIAPPLFTCEPVLSECCHLLRCFPGGPDAVLSLLERGILVCDFQLSKEFGPVRALMRKYAGVPMSLADACLVRMTELERDSVVVTIDGDFRVYRRNRRQAVRTIMPD
jgi:predicted nucleic acid-binding protein